MSAGLPDAGLVITRPRRPCDSCRKRKSRCDMNPGDPSCVLCRFHHQECTFVEDARPRKRKSVAREEDNGPPQDEPIKRLSVLAEKERDREEGVEDGTRHGAHQSHVRDDYANLKGPSLLKRTLGLQNHRHSKFLGSTSEYEQKLLALDALKTKDEIPIGRSCLRRVNERHTFLLHPDELSRNNEDEFRDLDAIEAIVSPHGPALVRLYFRIVHPSFPILHKKVFLEKYERTHREFAPPLLAAVYILALNWWSYSSELALLTKPDVPRLEKLALKTMNDIIHRPKLSTIQAGLLLLQRQEGDSWALTTQLVGLGQDLGLHMDCSNWKIPLWERGLRKRLAWALFMQDKWAALVHGRPSHITGDDWTVKPVSETDFPEKAIDEDDEDGSTEVEKGRVLFSEMIKLTQILGDILSTFYTQRAEEEIRTNCAHGVRWLLERAKPMQIRLRDWFSQLPECLRVENVKMRKLSSTGYLHLAYFSTEITLHRCILRYLSTEQDQALILICRGAAQARLDSAMEFVKSLKPEHLQSFWYCASKYCFAVIGSFVGLLWATSSDKEDASLYKQRLEEYRWMLRLSCRSADFMERALDMLAHSTGVLVMAIPEITNSAQQPTVQVQSGSKASSGFDYVEHVEELEHGDDGRSRLSQDLSGDEPTQTSMWLDPTRSLESLQHMDPQRQMDGFGISTMGIRPGTSSFLNDGIDFVIGETGYTSDSEPA
ncbi:fungal-specific transcription factor domain-containing protein [Lineolata rhizophorae]|uniref:Fungal-specific transcription factor domain-containing protein n=1 Tax=Lineolata rhizophorae TaxID=578093 RepID=A0A6A6P2C5_9PEZI|nr:fungal-specific transcription factor domain-containing protein [Lineolata rhizophorae]